ncbi:unnamed protein product [Cylindrotheca closterium]|uniref:BTB domain-containing protein n=1 Tax=Cylindrotheca closterium TaxID=2856 RepID=A0AAD2CQI0_9STRA|nr:unnamed protein product [Cylindrotheca closterium]
MTRDRYDVDLSIINDRERSAEIQFSAQEHIQDENQQTVANHRMPMAPTQIAKHNALSWRTDPVSSFSDWRIVIYSISKEASVTQTNFFCHSNVLAWGPRKGNFFVELFEKQRRKSDILVSKIKMNEEEAKMIPIVLDFMYCGSTLPLSADRLHILYGLAETLDIPKLKEAMQLFVQNAMDLNQLVDFLTFVSDRNIGATIQRLVLLAESRLFGFLVENVERGSLVPPQILYRILQKRKQCIGVLKKRNPIKYTRRWENERSKVIGRIIGECCVQAVNTNRPSPSLTLRMLETITNRAILPAIDGETALKILQVEGVLVQMSKCGSEHAQHESRMNDTNLLQLEKRCILMLVPEWRRMLRDNRPSIAVAMKTFTPTALAELLLSVSEMYEIGTSAPEPISTAYLENSAFQIGHSEADVLEEMVAEESFIDRF